MTPCDEWTGYRLLPSGYGQLHVAMVDGKQVQMYAHRLVWMQTFGHTDLFVLHSCDNPACINIEHLRAVTPADNSSDMVKRGRHWNTKKTHCSHGHEFTEDNIYRYRSRRYCKACNQAKNNKRNQQRREAKCQNLI